MVKIDRCKAATWAKVHGLALATVWLSCVGLLASAPAYAGGDEAEVADDSAVAGPSYYGFVRDTRGVGLANAEVVLTAPKIPPVMLKTNILGLYRSHVSKDAAPAEVKVTCSHAGYQLVKVTRRQGDLNARQVETICVLQKK